MPEPNETLTCTDAEALLEAFLDDEASAAESRRLERHLAGCAGCTAELALARQIRSTLRALPPQACPPAVIRAVAERTQASAPWTARLSAWLGTRRWQPAVALLVLFVAGLVLWPAAPTRPSRAEIARAEDEVKLALAYLGEIGEDAGTTAGRDVLERRVVVPVTRSLVDSLSLATAPAPEGKRHAL